MKSEFAFKVFLVTTCLFIVYLYAFLVFSFYVPYVDLILFFGFIWAFVRGKEKEYISAHYLCGTAVLVILYFLLCMIFGECKKHTINRMLLYLLMMEERQLHRNLYM